MMTLAIVFDKKMKRVLMCFHSKQNMWNFIGGHVEDMENHIDACYRELREETGITQDDIDLRFVRLEQVTTGYCEPWNLFIMTGVLKRNVKLVEEKNKLQWIPLSRRRFFVNETFGYGDCMTKLREALRVLGLDEQLMATYK